MLRRLLAGLIVALVVVTVAFAVVMGGFAIAQAAGDLWGSRVLWWVGMSLLMLLVGDALLLLGTLGLLALEPPRGPGPPRRPPGERPGGRPVNPVP